MAHAKGEKQQSDQIRAFRKAARELGCADNEERFQETLRTIAKGTPAAAAGSKDKAETLTVSWAQQQRWRSLTRL
jgi:hypothetical protein